VGGWLGGWVGGWAVDHNSRRFLWPMNR